MRILKAKLLMNKSVDVAIDIIRKRANIVRGIGVGTVSQRASPRTPKTKRQEYYGMSASIQK